MLDKLSFQQSAFAQKLPADSLGLLDLAALLRVLDQNWNDLAAHKEFSRETRGWLKEAQSIRNRWAHAPADGLPSDLIYRDLDTIERLCTSIGGGEAQLFALRDYKKALLESIAPSSKAVAVATEITVASTQFNIGNVVALKAKPEQTGAVIEVDDSGAETKYKVFQNGSIVNYFESQLQPLNAVSIEQAATVAQLNSALSALQLLHPSTNLLYSLASARINFVPYQFRPVLKLIQADRPRLLIADEVGVGKTIEAGLIIKELQARRELKSVLIICPKPLVAERKWQQEMKRFDERFEHLDGVTLRYCIDETHLDGQWPQKYARSIVPYSLLDEALLMGKQGSKKGGLLKLDPPLAFDLVIVDEAHAIRNSDTWAYRNVRYFCDNAQAVVLLSATPIQMGNKDLYTLLHLLRPDIITSPRDFERMAEPNPHINAAIELARAAKPDWKSKTKLALAQALKTPWGAGVTANSSQFAQAEVSLDASDDSIETRLSLVRNLEQLYTFAPLISRTRRRDIGNFTTRKPETISVPFTQEQAELNQNLLELLARMLAARHGERNLKFMMSTVRRQVSSCVFGLAPLLEAMLNRYLSQLELSDLGDDDDSADETANISSTLQLFKTDVQALIHQARAISGNDPKFDAFLKVVIDKQHHSNNKLLVFSSFRHTLSYLTTRLDQHTIRYGLIHGDIADEERRNLRHRFSLPKDAPDAFDVLLCSEVGCEGLDYQFCDGMVNYDLPWNPMRVEQRIGRIDRYGQKSEAVVIYNFITPGTVDADIFERCLERIGVFRQALGGSEEVLGRLSQELRNIVEDFTLTSTERANRLHLLTDNEVRIMQEQAQLEQDQSKFFGLAQPNQNQNRSSSQNQDAQLVAQASSYWLRPTMLENLVREYLAQLGATPSGNLPAQPGERIQHTLQLAQDIREKLLTDFKALPTAHAQGEVPQQWQRWLKGNDPYLFVTFNDTTAADKRDLTFITPNHPLAQQAATYLAPKATIHCQLQVQSSTVPPGAYPFAIYRWQKMGLKQDFSFQAVTANAALNAQLLPLLEVASVSNLAPTTIDESAQRQLDQSHYELWLNARAAHKETVAQLCSARKNSLATSYAAQIALLSEQRDNASDNKIRRMREGQITAAQRDYEQRLSEIERAVTQMDIVAQLVVNGVMEIMEVKA